MEKIVFYPEHHHRPDGSWRVYFNTFDVAGVSFRKKEAISFIDAAMKSDSKNWPYGLGVVWDTNNPHSKNGRALAVFGSATIETGLFRKKQEQKKWHIGYVPEGLLEKKVAIHTPVAGEIYRIYRGEGGFIDITMKLLLPGKGAECWDEKWDPWSR